MNRTERTCLIEAMEDKRLEELLALFADVELTVSLPPRSGLMMMTATDSFNTDFCLGEVLVTEARVIFRGCEGFGMVPGESPRRALARACADAVLGCAEPTRIGEELEIFLRQEEVLQRAGRAKAASLIAATRVNFDLMPGA